MKIPKKIKDIPWEEGFAGPEQVSFRVTLNWPVVDGEKWLVATFCRNRQNIRLRPAEDFRVIASKKQQRCTVLYRTERAGKRHSLDTALRIIGTTAISCYPEIADKDEIALAKWLGRRGTQNHLMPELSKWMEDALEAEAKTERMARGEIEDEEVELCPEELPEGLEGYIRRKVLPEDKRLIYKKGNVRGLCFVCGRQVRASTQRFRQHGYVYCPDCGTKVEALLETSDAFGVDYVVNVATIQRGADGKTLFVRLWHIKRDRTARWEDIAGQLVEVCRWVIRGDRAAKWQKEAKEGWYLNYWRTPLAEWERKRDVATVYDGSYCFYTPDNWAEIMAGTSLQYCPLGDYVKDEREYLDTIRFLVDWARYPAVEKLWKAGYTRLVRQKIQGIEKEHRYAVRWNRDTLQGATGLPLRVLRTKTPGDWTAENIHQVAEVWALQQKGTLTEPEAMELIRSGRNIQNIHAALGHAALHKILRYVAKQEAVEQAEREKTKAKHPNRYIPPLNTEQTYRDYLKDCVELGLNLDDKQVLFPRDLNAAHQRTITQVKYKADESKRAAFEKATKKYEELAWEQGDLLIRPARSPHELTMEGEALHHCVGGYADRMAEGQTVILFVRRAADPDKPYYTMEYRCGTVIQCRTDHNKSYEADEPVAKFVEDWLKHLAQKPKKRKKAAKAA